MGTISGFDDQPYPQTSNTAVVGLSRVQLFTGESVDGGLGRTYQTDPGGSVIVESGPIRGSSREVRGHARVVREDGRATHDLVFDIRY